MEERAATWEVVEADLTVKPFDDLFYDTESESRSPFLARTCGVGLSEFLEYSGFEICRDTGAMISHGDAYNAAGLLHCNQHFLSRRRELDRIREKVADDLGKPVGVSVHFAVCRFVVEPNSHAVCLGKSSASFNRLFDQRTYVHAA